MRTKFTNPLKLGINSKEIKTSQIVILYEDDDISELYPKYVPIPYELNSESGMRFVINLVENESRESCFLVLKNADFTEGRGPMYPVKIFKTITDAEIYVAGQKGIYDSPQYRQNIFGVSIHGIFYDLIQHNGYEIKKFNLD